MSEKSDWFGGNLLWKANSLKLIDIHLLLEGAEWTTVRSPKRAKKGKVPTFMAESCDGAEGRDTNWQAW